MPRSCARRCAGSAERILSATAENASSNRKTAAVVTVRETDEAVVTDTEARRMTAVGMSAEIRRVVIVETSAKAHRAVTVVTVAVAHHTAAVETSMEILPAAAIETHAVILPAAASGTNAEVRSTARKRMGIKNADKTVKERSGLSIAALFSIGYLYFPSGTQPFTRKNLL